MKNEHFFFLNLLPKIFLAGDSDAQGNMSEAYLIWWILNMINTDEDCMHGGIQSFYALYENYIASDFSEIIWIKNQKHPHSCFWG